MKIGERVCDTRRACGELSRDGSPCECSDDGAELCRWCHAKAIEVEERDVEAGQVAELRAALLDYASGIEVLGVKLAGRAWGR